MRKLTFAAALLVALVATGYAVADGMRGAKSATAVAATFTATGSSTSSRTCTTTDGKTVVVTNGNYTGTATGSTDLTGAITLQARSVINTTDKVGVVSGSLRIAPTSGNRTSASYSAVYDNGAIAGLASGRAHGQGAGLVANLSASFSATSGFTSGKLGGGTSGGSAVEVGGTSCKPSQTTTETSEAHGTISALSTTSITVAGLTCAIPSSMSADVNSKFKQNDTAQIRCSLVSGTNTLTSIGANHKGTTKNKHESRNKKH